jgi:hypothetical protein
MLGCIFQDCRIRPQVLRKLPDREIAFILSRGAAKDSISSLKRASTYLTDNAALREF